MLRPETHRCDEQSIDYGEVDEGLLRCVCGREWRLGTKGWSAAPLTKRRP